MDNYYLDANSSSRLRTSVRRELTRFAQEDWEAGNASSVHRPGRSARSLLRCARGQVLKLLSLGRDFPEAQIVFNSGGTEACNSMIRCLLPSKLTKLHAVTSAIEHPAVLEVFKVLETDGLEVDYILPNADGIVSLDSFTRELRPTTEIVSLMGANNETGAIQPIIELARILRSAGYKGLIVSDCIQLIGKSKVSIADFFKAGGDAITVSGHKLGAPSGIGALVLNRQTLTGICRPYLPLLLGGSQEDRFRAGTENIFGAVAFGRASEEVLSNLDANLGQIRNLRELLWSIISTEIADLERITPFAEEKSIANTLMIRIPGIRGDDFVVALDLAGVYASTGSACASGKVDVSHVLLAMGYSKDAAREVVRFSLDWDSTDSFVIGAAIKIIEVYKQMKNSSVSHSKSAGEAFRIS